MTNQEILTKAIQKAIDGGYMNVFDNVDELMEECHKSGNSWLIFSHDFAKALWGKGEPKEMTYFSTGTKYTNHVKGWKHHLQQMVIAEDPVAYLGENL